MDELVEHRSALAHFFDEEFYALSADARREGLDPLDHYLAKGEALGVAPSPLFDPTFYRRQYPDLSAWTDGLLAHFVLHGRSEGRSGTSLAAAIEMPTARLDPSRRNIIIVVHEATRSGAPILSLNLVRRFQKRYNAVVVLLAGGPIEQALDEAAAAVVRVPKGFSYGRFDGRLLGTRLHETYRPDYAIANSVATREVALVLERAGVPVIALIHEFSSYFQPIGILNPLYLAASRLVFSAQTVADASVKDYPGLRPRKLHIIPQGPTQVPPFAKHKAVATTPPAVPQRPLETLDLDGAAVVLGMGRIEYRKGVDAFISAAAEVKKSFKGKLRFVWAGHLDPIDASYFGFLQQQIERSGLGDEVVFAGEVDDVAAYYARADVFFLSSRLDPLPNVAIDAARLGVPVVCFANAGGIAEFLNGDFKTLVAPYMDSAVAGSAIVSLLRSPQRRRALAARLKSKARSYFDMGRYVRALDRLGRDCVDECAKMASDKQTIVASGLFNAPLRFGANAEKFTTDDAVEEYLNAARLSRPLARPFAGMLLRRAMEGFNPLAYAEDHPEVDRTAVDPLAHFLRAGQPTGRWSYPIIKPENHAEKPPPRLRVALHGHFYYPDLLEDFLPCLKVNSTPVDLFLSTGSAEKAKQIRAILRDFGLSRSHIWLVPNRGRDIGPFLKDLPEKLGGNYDIVGHFHGKRSKHVDTLIGDQWRDFMWHHLVGDSYPMVDVIAEAFARDPKLGLVFPEDPCLNGWDKNRDEAERLARRMRIAGPLPHYFDFPIGTMFWARVDALAPLFKLKLDWSEYPEEPLPIDGTILHALERILPFVAEKAGFRYAKTYVKSSMRDDWLAFARRPPSGE